MKSSSFAFCAAAWAALAATAAAWQPPAVEIAVRPETALGPIKPVNGVNGCPNAENPAGKRGTFRAFRAAAFPYARLHDTAATYDFAHTVDITCVFPDFSADENDPASYDFELTDHLLSRVVAAGTEPYYRLGQTIEHWKKKYGVKVPEDFGKWARICEHVIRHYTEGWADGKTWKIRYWEIWNEPDLHWPGQGAVPPTWTGDDAQFFEMYGIVAKHLKKCFPHLSIGGPAAALVRKDSMDWAARFLASARENGAPLDFFSWHQYPSAPGRIADMAREIRALLDSNGFENAESHLTEWNCNRDFGQQYWYATEHLVPGERGAAFVAAALCEGQNAPVDKMMHYQVAPASVLNGVFDARTRTPGKGYWAFMAWKTLRELGTQVAAGQPDDPEFHVCAARDPETGRMAALVARYRRDDSEMVVKTALVSFGGKTPPAGATVKYLDSNWNFQTMPAETAGGKIRIFMEPNSFALVEAEGF